MPKRKCPPQKDERQRDIRCYFPPSSRAIVEAGAAPTVRASIVLPSVPAASAATPIRKRSTVAKQVTPAPTKKPALNPKKSSVSKASSAGKRALFSVFNTCADRSPFVNRRKVNWEEHRKELVKKFEDNSYLSQHHLGQLKQEQERASAAGGSHGSDRDTIHTCKTNALHAGTSMEPSMVEAPSFRHGSILMSAQQKLIAQHPPHIPLEAGAGAGTGKTQTMVTRAIKLATQHGVDPGKILVLTFTKKASGEMLERIKAHFAAVNGTDDEDAYSSIPTVKTFHSLAYHWICTFWKGCGLRRYPNPITTKAQQKKFMGHVIQAHLKLLQLKRCYKYLDLEFPDSEYSLSWDTVIEIMQKRFPDRYEEACSNAEEERANGAKKSKQGAKTTATSTKNAAKSPRRQAWKVSSA